MNIQRLQSIKRKFGFKHPKHGQLLLDAILVVISLAVPHTSLPIAVFAIVRIGMDFHKTRKEGDDKEKMD